MPLVGNGLTTRRGEGLTHPRPKAVLAHFVPKETHPAL